MARTTIKRIRKPYIIVFWEGESEEQYFKFLKDRFHDRAIIRVHSKKGVFSVADKAFDHAGQYGNYCLEVDEVWFVFDTEVELRNKWDEYWAIIKRIRRKCKHAFMRLLMTKGCIEYFFMLHYEKIKPAIETTADKESILKMLKGEKYCPGYEKGDKTSIWKIAESYEVGLENGEWSLKMLSDELKAYENYDDKVKALFLTDSTFTNTHEAISYLMELVNR